ncbi:MAG: hypothetical protein ABSG63_03270 [Spirochaetia bacterium]
MTAFFFLRSQGPPEDAGYQHCMIALGEGLRELGVPFFANIDYWREETGWLFKGGSGVQLEDCDLVITGDEYQGVGGELPKSMFGGRQRTVFVDSSDGWRTRTEAPDYRRFDLVLRTHCSRRYTYPDNTHPWAFGLSQRIMTACADPAAFAGRSNRLIANFRVGHPVRAVARKLVMPVAASRLQIDDSIDSPPAEDAGRDRLLWEATGRRHYPAYFARLLSSKACAAFGGYFAPGVFRSTENVLERALYALGWRLGRKSRTVMQFDSWRLWEALCAGSLMLHVDLDAYCCSLPSMPVNGVHYAGFDFHRRDCAAFLRDAPEKDLAAIAVAGRAWVLDQYSPRAAARRLLAMIGGG